MNDDQVLYHFCSKSSLDTSNQWIFVMVVTPVGNVFPHLTAKLACHAVHEDVGNYFRPHQVGFTTQRGCEAAIHAVRTFANAPKNVGKVLLKIDYKSALNSVESDVMLQEVSKKTPSLFPFLWQCYSFSTDLLFGNQVIPSLVGVQQGDPAGPMTFSLAIQPIIDELKSELNVFYLDDGTLSNDPEVVLFDFMNLIGRSQELGLQVNSMKCELYFCSGAPVFEEAFLEFTTEKFKSLETMINRLIGLPSHVAYFLLKNCFAIPKLTYLLRTSPAWKFPEWCSASDNKLKNGLESILNIQLDCVQWTQASLPIKSGGLGIRKITDIALPAFLASTFGVHALVNLICPSLDEGTVHLEEEAKEIWNKLNPSNIPTLPTYQRNWDIINIQRIIVNTFTIDSFTEIARLKALQLPESVETFGPWSKEAQDLVHTIGTNLNQISGDSRSKQFLTQRISLAIQRGNAACVFETLPSSTP
ncbi:hypothetical protein ILUMI_21068 [Ignelater luminosus]|uniref:Reverse transcriptase domain-containing protein n=1 Tax=Ignelater luminosus TaxID=2038154 RepID=A0A8K0G414_IGNLU|nr:hypothetical protein ILUMI_21068 [Ignelater luminosus]